MTGTFSLMAIVPESLLGLAGLALLVLGAFRERFAGLVTALATIALIVAAIAAMVVDGTPRTAFNGHFILDSYAAFLKVVIYLAAAGSLLISPAFLRDNRIERFEYPVLAIFAALGMGMMVSANSLLALYMALELQSLALYVLTAIDRDTARASEAGLKYFVLGALASGMLLYGASLIYGFTGTLAFPRLAEILAPADPASAHRLASGAVVGVVFLLAGLAFKLAAVPFHMWTPDVYEGAPTTVTAFIAAAPKLAAIGLTVRVLMQPFANHVADWQQVVVVIAVGSMLLGSFAAIGQTNIKRLMAYSAIAQIGFALLGLAAGTSAGVVAVLIYMVIYIAMTLGTFGCILMMRRQGHYLETIDELAGLSRRRPVMALMMAVMMFSLAGIPPLAGFFAKFYVFMAAIGAGLTVVAVIGVLASVVGAYYYLRLVKLMYFDEPVAAFDATPHPGLLAVTGLASALLVIFIVFPGPLIRAATAAAASLAPT